MQKNINHLIPSLNSILSHIEGPFASLLENTCCGDFDNIQFYNSLLNSQNDINAHKHLDELENAPFYVHWKDMNSTYIACNNRTANDIGLPTESVLKSSDFDFHSLSKTQIQCYRQHDEIVRTTGKPQFFIEPVTCVGGKEIISIAHKSPLRLRSKKIVGTKCLAFILKNDEQTYLNLSLNSSSIYSKKLTEKQLNCLLYLVKGMTVKQIAITLGLSSKTVEHYMETIKNKLNCYTRSDLIQKALQINSIRERL